MYLEDLNINGMIKNHNLAKSIEDCSLYTLTNMLEYKAKLCGREIIKINRFFPSSQICFICGYQNKDTKNLMLENGNVQNVIQYTIEI